MMYKHQVDECIERAKALLRMHRRFNQRESVDHVQRRLESLERIREKAPTAYIGAKW